MKETETKVVLITDGVKGIGLGLAARLLSRGMKVYITSNSKARCDRYFLLFIIIFRAIHKLKAIFPDAQVAYIVIDLSNPISVMNGAQEYQKHEQKLDYLFLNNNFMPIAKSSTLTTFFRMFLESFKTYSIQRLLLTGRSTNNDQTIFPQQEGLKTSQGYGLLISEHVMGHFILLQELNVNLLLSKSQGMIIWTGSLMACKNSFSFNDIQCLETDDPFGATQYMIDLVNIAINEHFYSNGIKSIVCCPGLVLTRQSPLMFRMSEIWLLILAFFVPTVRVFGSRGAAIHCELIDMLPNGLDYRKKYMMKYDEIDTSDSFENEIDPKDGDRLYQVYFLSFIISLVFITDVYDCISIVSSQIH